MSGVLAAPSSARRPSLASLASGLLIAFVLCGVGLTWTEVVRSLASPKPVPVHASGQSASLVWGSRVFLDKQAMSRWLRARGTSYAAWARHHPNAASMVDPAGARRAAAARVAHARSLQGKQNARASRSPTRAHVTAFSDETATAGTAWAKVFAAAFAIVLALFALSPRSILPRRLRRSRVLANLKLYAAAGSLASMFGLLVATLN
jgi:hypothetical protein